MCGPPKLASGWPPGCRSLSAPAAGHGMLVVVLGLLAVAATTPSSPRLHLISTLGDNRIIVDSCGLGFGPR